MQFRPRLTCDTTRCDMHCSALLSCIANANQQKLHCVRYNSFILSQIVQLLPCCCCSYQALSTAPPPPHHRRDLSRSCAAAYTATRDDVPARPKPLHFINSVKVAFCIRQAYRRMRQRFLLMVHRFSPVRLQQKSVDHLCRVEESESE